MQRRSGEGSRRAWAAVCLAGRARARCAPRAHARKGDFLPTLVFRNIAARKTMLLLLAALLLSSASLLWAHTRVANLDSGAPRRRLDRILPVE